MLKSYSEQDNVAPTQHYLVGMKLQRKISLCLSQFLSELKSTIMLFNVLNIIFEYSQTMFYFLMIYED